MKARSILTVVFVWLVSTVEAQPDSVLPVTSLQDLSLEELMNVKVVTASGVAQSVVDAPSTIRVITAKQIEERGYNQLEDVLRDMEGVDLIHAGGGMPTIFYFRGMYGAENLRTLILIDGVKENNIVGSGDLAGPAYSLHNVERIEIIWGPASALYGADAFGGVINIITKKGSEINSLYYEKAYGTFNTSQDRLMFGARRRSLEFSFSGSLYSTDGPRYSNRDPYYKGAYVDKARSFYVNVTHVYKKFKTTLSYRDFDTPMSWGNFLNSSTKALGLPAPGNGNSGAIGILTEDIRNEKPSLYESFSRSGIIETQYTHNYKFSVTARAIYRETGLSDNSYVYLSIDTNIAKGIDTAHIYRVPTVNYSNRVRGDLFMNYAPSVNHRLNAGILVTQDNLEIGNRGEILDTNKYVLDGIPVTNLHPVMKPRKFSIRNNFASYFQYVWSTTFLRKTSITTGLRYDYNSDYTNPLSPRIAIVSQPYRMLTIKLLYGKAFRSPTPTEVASQKTTFGDKAVNPEKVNTYELDLIYQRTSKFLIQLNGFDNELGDIYVLNSLIGGNFGTKQSLGRASIYGGEVHVDFFPHPMFSGFTNFTYQHGTETDLGANTTFAITNLPTYKGNAGITWHGRDLFTITAIGNWIGDRRLPHTNPYGADKDYKMKGYFLTNIILTTQKFFESRVNASVNIRNVFNIHYLDPGMRTADGVLYSTAMEQPGRNVLFKVTVSF